MCVCTCVMITARLVAVLFSLTNFCTSKPKGEQNHKSACYRTKWWCTCATKYVLKLNCFLLPIPKSILSSSMCCALFALDVVYAVATALLCGSFTFLSIEHLFGSNAFSVQQFSRLSVVVRYDVPFCCVCVHRSPLLLERTCLFYFERCHSIYLLFCSNITKYVNYDNLHNS